MSSITRRNPLSSRKKIILGKRLRSLEVAASVGPPGGSLLHPTLLTAG